MKHLILLLILVNINFSGIAQKSKNQSINIRADISGLKDGATYYLNGMSGAGIDSCISKYGKLYFNYIGEPDRLFISTSADNGDDGSAVTLAMFWSDSRDIYITGNMDRLTEVSIKGSPMNDVLQVFGSKITPLEDQRDEYIVYQKNHKLDSINLIIKNSYNEFIKKHPGSYPGIVILYYTVLNNTFAPAEASVILDSLFQDLKDSYYHGAINKLISNTEQLKIGAIAPDFTQQSLNGKPISLSDFRGKYVLIEFGASWCGPCRQENPNLVKLYSQYKNKGFEILGVSLDMNRNTWKRTTETDGMVWPQVSDLKGWRNEVAQLYGVNGVPQNFLLDPRGKIIAKDLRGDSLEKKVAEVMK